jgi:hypothetical protein
LESKWKNYDITNFPGQSLSKTGLSLEEALDLSPDRQIEEEDIVVPLPSNRTKAKTLPPYCRCQATAPEQTPKETLDLM